MSVHPRPQPIPAPILPPASRAVKRRHHRRKGEEGDREAVPRTVDRRFAGHERVRRDDAADLAEAELEGGADGAATVAA